MKHPLLQRKLTDHAYEERSLPYLLIHVLTLIPFIVFVVLTSVESGPPSAAIVTVVCATYVSLFLVQYAVVRRSVLAAMRREGLVDDGYQAPVS